MVACLDLLASVSVAASVDTFADAFLGAVVAASASALALPSFGWDLGSSQLADPYEWPLHMVVLSAMNSS